MKNDLVLIYPPLNNYYLDDLNKTDSNNKIYSKPIYIIKLIKKYHII